MNSFEFLEKLGFSSNEAKVYGTLIKHKVLNGYEIAKLSGVARSLVYEVINRLIAKGAVIRIDGEPNFYKPIEYQDLIRSIKEENEKNIACAERELQQLATENADVDYVMNIVGEEKYVAKAKELIDSAQAEISLSIWQESFEVLRSNIENAISRGVKVYIFTFESISVAGATVYSYNINDVSTLFPYRRTTIIIDGGECLVGEEGDRNVYVHTRNHSVVSLATDEIVLNVFWNKLIEKENLLYKSPSFLSKRSCCSDVKDTFNVSGLRNVKLPISRLRVRLIIWANVMKAFYVSYGIYTFLSVLVICYYMIIRQCLLQ
jgi:HTH-type transcriptional regulator, sugar sensing transcriptional regulator